jgi:hypothetical protein
VPHSKSVSLFDSLGSARYQAATVLNKEELNTIKKDSIFFRLLFWDIKGRDFTAEEQEFYKEKLDSRVNLYTKWHKENFLRGIVKRIKAYEVRKGRIPDVKKETPSLLGTWKIPVIQEETGSIVERDTNMTYEDAAMNLDLVVTDPELTYEKIEAAGQKFITMNDPNRGGSTYLNAVFVTSVEMLKIGLDNEAIGPFYKPELNLKPSGENTGMNPDVKDRQKKQKESEENKQESDEPPK